VGSVYISVARTTRAISEEVKSKEKAHVWKCCTRVGVGVEDKRGRGEPRGSRREGVLHMAFGQRGGKRGQAWNPVLATREKNSGVPFR